MAKETEFTFPPQGHIAPLIFDSVAKKWYAIKGSGYDYLQVDVQSSALPNLAATSANQVLALALLDVISDGLQLRRGDHVRDGYTAAPGNTNWHDLTNLSGAGVVEYLSFASDHATSALRLILDGEYVIVLDVDGVAAQTGVRASYLQYGTFEGSVWKLIAYDVGNDHYGIALKRPVWYNSTLQIAYKAGSATAVVAVSAGYHTF